MTASSGPSSATRWLPLGGVIFVALTVVSVVVLGGNTPSPGDSAVKIRSYYDDHRVREFIAVFVLAASVPFLLFFTTYLANVTAGSQGRRSVWQLLFLGGSVAVGIAWIGSAFIHFALTDGVDQKLPDASLQTLNLLDGDSWVLFNSAIGLMMLGAAGTLLTASVTAGYRRLGWCALILGIAAFIPFADFFALLLTGVWIIVASIMAARAKDPLVAVGTSTAV